MRQILILDRGGICPIYGLDTSDANAIFHTA